jgi:imidazolonepropionase
MTEELITELSRLHDLRVISRTSIMRHKKSDKSLPEIAREGLADAVDAFMEGIAFSGGQTARVFEVAKRLGLPVKLHADQLSNLGGAVLAARYGALSADHLEYTDETGAAAMAKAGTVAVLLPGAFYFIRETHKPAVELFRKHKVPIAIATDCNPGSSPLSSLLLTMNMAATLFRLTVDEIVAVADTVVVRPDPQPIAI